MQQLNEKDARNNAVKLMNLPGLAEIDDYFETLEEAIKVNPE